MGDRSNIILQAAEAAFVCIAAPLRVPDLYSRTLKGAGLGEGIIQETQFLFWG